MNKASKSIIPRSDHIISRSALSSNAVRVLYRLHDHGFISYLVGGCVRDLLLGREPKDFDIATDATPGQIKRMFRNCRLIGRRFRLAHLHFQDEILEVATFRSLLSGESEEELTENNEGEEQQDRNRPHGPRHLKSTDGMILRDNVFGTPEEDARRRDFTINALYYNIADFSIIDHVGGMYDLQNGIIRIIGNPYERFTEDPVRMVRAVRFAALLGFTIEPATWDALVKLSHTINRAAPARLYEEILKLFLSGEGAKTWQMLRQTGLFTALFPHFDRWLGEETGSFPHTGPGEALTWIDARIQEGEKVSAPLLFALLFSQYLEEKIEKCRAEGLPFQQCLDAAVAELLGELAPTVLVPNRTGVLVRAILSYQRRFLKTPGRQPHSFINRYGFQEALQFLRFCSESSGKGLQLYSWWKEYCRDRVEAQSQETGEEGQETSVSKKRRRRRKRRHRPARADS